MQLKIATYCSIFIELYRMKWRVINYNDKEIIASFITKQILEFFHVPRTRTHTNSATTFAYCSTINIFISCKTKRMFWHLYGSINLWFLYTHTHAHIYYLQQKCWLMSVLCTYASIYTILSSSRCMFLKLYIRKYSLNDARQARVYLPFEMHYLPIYINYNTILYYNMIAGRVEKSLCGCICFRLQLHEQHCTKDSQTTGEYD